MKHEIRNPKSEIRRKLEGRNLTERSKDERGGFGFQISDFFRISDFGFRICTSWN